MAGALFRIFWEVGRSKRAKEPSDLQKAADEKADEEAVVRVHAMEPGWYPEYGDDNTRSYWDGTAFTLTEHWDGTAWRAKDSQS